MAEDTETTPQHLTKDILTSKTGFIDYSDKNVHTKCFRAELAV